MVPGQGSTDSVWLRCLESWTAAPMLSANYELQLSCSKPQALLALVRGSTAAGRCAGDGASFANVRRSREYSLDAGHGKAWKTLLLFPCP